MAKALSVFAFLCSIYALTSFILVKYEKSHNH
jgi:hypothetical protein